MTHRSNRKWLTDLTASDVERKDTKISGCPRRGYGTMTCVERKGQDESNSKTKNRNKGSVRDDI